MNRSASVRSANFNKTAVQNSDHKASRELLLSRTHGHSVTIVALCVFLVHAFTMIAIQLLHNFATWLAALLNTSILIILLSPMLYLLVFFPLVNYISKYQRTGQTLPERTRGFRTIFQARHDADIIVWRQNCP